MPALTAAQREGLDSYARDVAKRALTSGCAYALRDLEGSEHRAAAATDGNDDEDGKLLFSGTGAYRRPQKGGAGGSGRTREESAMYRPGVSAAAASPSGCVNLDLDDADGLVLREMMTDGADGAFSVKEWGATGAKVTTVAHTSRATAPRPDDMCDRPVAAF